MMFSSMGNLFLTHSSVFTDQEFDCFKAKGSINKLKGLGWGLAARAAAVGAAVFSVVDVALDGIRCLVNPCSILIDGGINVNTLKRIGKTVGSIMTRSICLPITAACSVVAPEITVGRYRLDKKLAKLDIISITQTAGYVHTTALGTFLSQRDSQMRADVAQKAAEFMENDRNNIMEGKILREDCGVTSAFFQVVQNMVGEESSKDAASLKTLQGRVSLLNDIEATDLLGKYDRNKDMNVFLRCVGATKVNLQEEGMSNDVAWKLALFDTITSSEVTKEEGAYRFKVPHLLGDESPQKLRLAFMNMEDLKILTPEEKNAIRGHIKNNTNPSPADNEQKQVEFMDAFRGIFERFKAIVTKDRQGKLFWDEEKTLPSKTIEDLFFHR